MNKKLWTKEGTIAEAHLGIVGLNRNGKRLAQRALRLGSPVFAYVQNQIEEPLKQAGLCSVYTEKGLVRQLKSPRIIFLFGCSIRTFVRLSEWLCEDDVVIDCVSRSDISPTGFDCFRDSRSQGGIQMVDGGAFTSGDCDLFLLGGAPESIATLRQVNPRLFDEGTFMHLGPAGAGRFAKAVHDTVVHKIKDTVAEAVAEFRREDRVLDVAAVLRAFSHSPALDVWQEATKPSLIASHEGFQERDPSETSSFPHQLIA